jgi:hypothetical protein
MYIGVDFIGINLAAPFLMLGIGIDDTFVILAAWRLTSVHDPVPLRMATAYREAAVSGRGTTIGRKKQRLYTKTNDDIFSSCLYLQYSQSWNDSRSNYTPFTRRPNTQILLAACLKSLKIR